MIYFKNWLNQDEHFFNTDNLFFEVFDRANLDGVKITDGSSSINYEFEDTVEGKKYYYEVSVTRVMLYESYVSIYNFSDEYSHLYSQFKAKYPHSWDTGVIAFGYDAARIGPTVNLRYDASGLGNQVFVYGKVLACIQDAMSKHKPLFINFSGAQRSMDLVYDKFIKMSQRAYPQDAYVQYYDSYYIRKEVYDLIPDEARLESQRKKRELELQDIRKNKNRYR
jgi:hypothetical protein